MISLIVGVCIVVAILVFIYLIRVVGRKTESQEIEQTPVGVGGVDHVDSTPAIPDSDIVLASIIVRKAGGVVDRVLMWNAPPNGSYDYIITDDDREIAKGTSTSSTGLYQVRGLNLIDRKTYVVTVGGTRVTVPFSPPTFVLHTLDVQPRKIECKCDVVPTSIELVVGGIKLPISRCQMTIEPPGFICNLTEDLVEGIESHIVVYNGANACSILVV